MSVLYKINSLRWDSTNKALYICTTQGDETKSVWSLVGNGVGGGGLNPRGIWVQGTTYNLNDMVIVQTGVAAGAYYSTIANNNNDPATGIGWVQFPQNQSVGSWT